MLNKLASLSYNQSTAVKFAIDEEDPAIVEHFKKTAAQLKAIAPKANDFLYFTAIMMHSAEAALIDDDGNLRKTADGKDVEAHWEKLPNGGITWKSNFNGRWFRKKY
jgi:cytochrome oxidase Cu insertion factor (SCO1/SenC/PrrC family)